MKTCDRRLHVKVRREQVQKLELALAARRDGVKELEIIMGRALKTGRREEASFRKVSAPRIDILGFRRVLDMRKAPLSINNR